MATDLTSKRQINIDRRGEGGAEPAIGSAPIATSDRSDATTDKDAALPPSQAGQMDSVTTPAAAMTTTATPNIAATQPAAQQSPKPPADSIVMSANHERAFRRARRHSWFVRFMKVLLPTGAIALVAMFGVMLSANRLVPLPKGHKLDLGVPQITPAGLAMTNPKYRGFNEDGSKFFVTAKRAVPDLKRIGRVSMTAITGTLTQADASKTHLQAVRGFFNNGGRTLELFEQINIQSESGFKAQLKSAKVYIKQSRIVTNQPINAQMPTGSISAQAMTIWQKKRMVLFTRGVSVRLTPKKPAPSIMPPGTKPKAKSAGLMGNSSAPVDVVAMRLRVNHATQVATFRNSVTATQDGQRLTTQVLEVHYQDSPKSNKGNGDGTANKRAPFAFGGATQSGSKLKLIKAIGKVVMTSTNDRQASADTAQFHAGKETSVLSGNVRLRQGNNTATGDHLVLDHKTQGAVLSGHVRVAQGTSVATGDKLVINRSQETAILIGNVTIRQERNVLRGTRFYINRRTAKSQMTAAGRSGRIFARFYQQAGKGRGKSALARKKPPRKKTNSALTGLTPGQFKTDPNEPITIEAKRLDVDDKAKTAVFKGKVVAVQGDITLRSATVIATYAGQTGMALQGGAIIGDQPTRQLKQKATTKPKTPAQLRRIEARGGVKITSKDGRKASGEWADFDVKANKIILGGNVTLTQGTNVLVGDRLEINLTSGRVRLINRAKPVAAGSIAAHKAFPTGRCSSGRMCLQMIPGQFQKRMQRKKKPAVPDGWNTLTSQGAKKSKSLAPWQPSTSASEAFRAQ